MTRDQCMQVGEVSNFWLKLTTLTLFSAVMLGGCLIVMELDNLTYKQVQVAKPCQQIYKSYFQVTNYSHSFSTLQFIYRTG